MKTHKIIIKAKDVKPSYGHQDRSQHHIHEDRRIKRKRTRGAKFRQSMRDQ